MWKKNDSDPKAWIDRCERDFEERLMRLADEVRAIPHVKLILLAGPTCSGKTTLAKMLQARFGEAGKRLHLISIDDFFYDREILHALSQRSGRGEIDYDSPDTIDLEALKRFTRAIFLEDVADCPIFDFVTGVRTGVRRMESREEDVFLFEGIQVLYPQLRALFAEYGEAVSLYIAPQRSLTEGGTEWSPNQLRLLRRLVRDAHFRATPPEQTFLLWSGVRRNEEENIFPYVKDCDHFLDSTMPYELGVLKPYLCKILPTVPADSPYRARAEEILQGLEGVEPLSDALIPQNSLYREFI